jgi:hypothetical protein
VYEMPRVVLLLMDKQDVIKAMQLLLKIHDVAMVDGALGTCDEYRNSAGDCIICNMTRSVTYAIMELRSKNG